jgi:hypothetical protein
MIDEKNIQTLIGKNVFYVSADKSLQVGGILTFAGYNELVPNWKYQLTISRMPVTHVDLDNDSLIEQTENTIVTKALI